MHTIFLANLGGGQSHNRLVLGSIVALLVLSEVTELMLLLLWAAINLVHVSLVLVYVWTCSTSFKKKLLWKSLSIVVRKGVYSNDL